MVSSLVRLIVRDEISQKDRFICDNPDAMAQKVRGMHAKLVKQKAMGERVSSPSGMTAEELKPLQRGGGAGGLAVGKGGPYVPAPSPSLAQLLTLVAAWTDRFTYIESRLQDSRLSALMVPSASPVAGPAGSGFGFRSDPINGRPALHSDLNFPAEFGTAITAAAGGIVVTNEWRPGYGHVLEIDHGTGLVMRYAHCSSIEVPIGALVKRGQLVAKVDNSSRSMGSQLHFEVLVDGAPQDPARFLAALAAPGTESAARPGRR